MGESCIPFSQRWGKEVVSHWSKWTISHCIFYRLQATVRRCSATQSCPALCDHVDCSRQAPLSMGFSRQEYWSWLPFPTPGYLPNPVIESTSLASPAWQADSLPLYRILVISHCDFNLKSPWWLMLNILSFIYNCHSFFGEITVYFFCPFLTGLFVVVFYSEFQVFFIYLG